ncbi:disease resistance protein, partial [Trifolium medium]|nr:disease resistance protein [Trifolium medium]
MPNVGIVALKRYNLSLCLPMVIMWFANMEILDLSGSDFRVLPEFLKECTSLHTLKLDDCHSLEDICAIPPNLRRLSALNCKSLNSSSKSMLVNKVLLYFLPESGRTTEYCFPSAEGEMIPEWFKHQSRGRTFPFWFRNKLPFIMIFFTTNSKPNFDESPTNHYVKKRKLRYLSLSQQCSQPLLKKQRLLDVEDLDTELV